MHSDRLLAATLMLLTTPLAAAFEPGTRRVCEPSADGRRFECRDVQGQSGQGPALAAEPPARVPMPAPQLAQAKPDPLPEPVEPPRARTARDLPNYLRQDPASGPPPAEPVVEARPAQREVAPPPPPPAPAPEPAPVQAPEPAPAPAPVVEPATAASESRVEVETRAPVAPSEPEVPAAIPAPAPEPEPASAPAPGPTAAQPEPMTAPAYPARAPEAATAFRALPAGHYTVELSRSRDRNALLAVAASFDTLDGTLYLLRLRTPDSEAWHLFWSNFPTPESAREARARLPAEVMLSSGWPRRIGPLQSESVGD